jgi:hypothetical protein
MRTLLLLAVAALAAPAPVLFAQAAPQQPVPHPVDRLRHGREAGGRGLDRRDHQGALRRDLRPRRRRRDWDRLRSLFIPGGRLIPTGIRPNGGTGMRLLDVNDYIAVTGPVLERIGFREREISRRVDEYGHIAHVFSTYEGRGEADSAPTRGINSIQLVNDGTRWWVVSVYWAAETRGAPHPAAVPSAVTPPERSATPTPALTPPPGAQ